MICLILAPYGAFAGLMLVTSATASLFVAAAICLAVIAWDAIGGRSVKILSTGSAILFAALGGYVALVDSSWTVSQVRLAVDAGMLAISLGSILFRTPFTLQISRELVDAETLALPGFIQANYVITWAWTLSFALMVMANVMLIYVPGLPLWIGLAIAFAARNSALYFTKWYPQHRRAKFSTPAATV